MNFNKIIYLLSESFKSIYRSIVPSIISSLTISTSLVVLSITYFLYMNMQEYTSKLKDEYKIEVFFNKDLNIKRALSVFNEILLIDGVEEGRFIDKEDASEIFISEFDEDILNIIGSNPLPMGASYGIADGFRTYAGMNKIVDKINSIRNVDEAIFSKGAINKFDTISRNLLGFSFLLGLFIMFISLFFVSNTIMLVIYSKKDEIKTMNLLGASNIFIKFPYLLEGLILGFVGAVISLIILFWFYKLCVYIIEPHFFVTSSFNYSSVIFMNLVFGILLGLIGSSRALASRVIK